jgi:hypothetical protein
MPRMTIPRVGKKRELENHFAHDHAAFLFLSIIVTDVHLSYLPYSNAP